MTAQLIAFPRPTPTPAPADVERGALNWRPAELLLSPLVASRRGLELDHPDRWLRWALATPGIVVRDLLTLLDLPPELVGVRALRGFGPYPYARTAITGPAMGFRDGPLAMVGAGLSLAEAVDTLAGLARAGWRPEGRITHLRTH